MELLSLTSVFPLSNYPKNRCGFPVKLDEPGRKWRLLMSQIEKISNKNKKKSEKWFPGPAEACYSELFEPSSPQMIWKKKKTAVMDGVPSGIRDPPVSFGYVTFLILPTDCQGGWCNWGKTMTGHVPDTWELGTSTEGGWFLGAWKMMMKGGGAMESKLRGQLHVGGQETR